MQRTDYPLAHIKQHHPNNPCPGQWQCTFSPDGTMNLKTHFDKKESHTYAIEHSEIKSLSPCGTGVSSTGIHTHKTWMIIGRMFYEYLVETGLQHKEIDSWKTSFPKEVSSHMFQMPLGKNTLLVKVNSFKHWGNDLQGLKVFTIFEYIKIYPTGL